MEDEPPFDVNILIQRKPVPYALKQGRNRIIYNPRKIEKQTCEWLIRAQYSGTPYEKAVSVYYRFGIKIPKSWSKKKQKEAIAGLILPCTRIDEDNLAKFYNDCIKRIVIKDDALIVDSLVRKVYALEPFIEIKIKPYYNCTKLCQKKLKKDTNLEEDNVALSTTG